MTLDAWKLSVALIALYLGAFLAGIRPGRWVGTRLLPLAGVAILVALIQFLAVPLVALAAVAALGTVLVGLILFVAQTRDYS